MSWALAMLAYATAGYYALHLLFKYVLCDYEPQLMDLVYGARIRTTPK